MGIELPTKLIVIGAGVVERHSDGLLYGKASVVEYVHQLKEFFQNVTWIANLYSGPLLFQSEVDQSRIDVKIIKDGGLRDIATLMGYFLKQKDNTVLLHLPHSLMSLIVCLFRWRVKHLAVYIASDWQQLVLKEDISYGFFRRKLYSFLHFLPIKLADTVIARGKRLKQITEKYNENVHQTVAILSRYIQPNIIDSERKFTSDKVNILFVGKLIESKGVRILLDAFTKLNIRTNDKELKLTFVGDGNLADELKEIVNQGTLNEKVKFLGWVDDQKKLSEIYSSSHILVCPSYSEGVPRVIEEAMMYSVCVIATDVGGIGAEFSDGEVLLIPFNSVEALVFALESVIYNHELREQMLSKCEKRMDSLLASETAAEQHARLVLGLQ